MDPNQTGCQLWHDPRRQDCNVDLGRNRDGGKRRSGQLKITECAQGVSEEEMCTSTEATIVD